MKGNLQLMSFFQHHKTVQPHAAFPSPARAGPDKLYRFHRLELGKCSDCYMNLIDNVISTKIMHTVL